MRIAIISDIHGNLEALRALPSDYDELWVLGDLVDYGPNPAEVVEFVRSHANVVVRGNHDHAAGCNADPRCSPAFREMALVTVAYTRSVLSSAQLEYLGNLPLTVRKEVDGVSFYLCHAAPSDPLFLYLPSHSAVWADELCHAGTSALLTGHTHKQFMRFVGHGFIVNPGSLGQPKEGGVEACYAIWDGGIELRRYRYPIGETVEKVRRMPVPAEVRADLVSVLESGGLPIAKAPVRE